MSHAENCQGKAVYVSSRFWGDADWGIYRCPICMGGHESAGHWTYDDKPQRRVYMDGDMWCVTGTDFVNLTESPAGFGKTQLEAANNYKIALGKEPRPA